MTLFDDPGTIMHTSTKFHENRSTLSLSGKSEHFGLCLAVNGLVHVPYLPDLTSCDFFLFATLKDHLQGRELMTLRPCRSLAVLLTDV